jgi:hypothetical protein
VYCNKTFAYVHSKQKHEASCQMLKQQLLQPIPIIFQPIPPAPSNENEPNDDDGSNIRIRHKYKIQENLDEHSKCFVDKFKLYLEMQTVPAKIEQMQKKHGKLSKYTIIGYSSNIKQFFGWMNVCLFFFLLY